MRELTTAEMEQVGGGDCTGFLYYVISGGTICCSGRPGGCFQF